MVWWKKKKKKPNFERGAKLLEELIECCDGKSNPIKFFSADQICEATDNFSESNHVAGLDTSENNRYKWYSGKNEDHQMLLIKIIDEHEVCRDVAISSMVSGHKNFLKLVGCCLEFEVPVMVYDDVKKHHPLVLREQPWKRRMKIAEDIATALTYLHTAFPRPFVYRILSLGKILLSEDGVAKLRDFNFCVSIPEGETFVDGDRYAGSVRYMDPRYAICCQVSEKTDVFATGVLMDVLLAGKERDWDSISLYGERMEFLYRQRMEDITDPEMVEKIGEISEEELCQMKAFLMLSQRCTNYTDHTGEELPTMLEVAKELKKIQRSLQKEDSSSPSGETQFDSAQGISSPLGAKLLEELIECCDGKSNPIKFFLTHQIYKATDNFSESNHVAGLDTSENNRYKWYSGKNEDHQMLLIKIIDEEQFCRDVAISSMVSGHENFLKLVGCCLESKVPFMVYDDVKKHHQLVLREQPWKRRMKIAEDIATALTYLHTAFPRPFVYRILSLGKVLLSEDGVAKLRDFYFCVSIPEGETYVDTRVLGSFNYMDPRYAFCGQASEKTDVYATGVLMDVLLTGKERDLDSILLYGQRMEDIADPEMVEKMGEISEEELCQMKAFLMLSQRCTNYTDGTVEELPTMLEVHKELKKIQRSLQKEDSSSISFR